MCRALSVNRPDYYRWLHQTPTKRELENQDLQQRIQALWLKNEKRYGAIKLYKALAKQLAPLGRKCSLKRVQTIMKVLGIRSIIRKKWKPTKASQDDGINRPNLLKQDFSTKQINQKWSADITYV